VKDRRTRWREPSHPAGCWRPERSWIDRLGRALGVYWIGVTLLFGWLWTLADSLQ
jgi:hypothetical protein